MMIIIGIAIISIMLFLIILLRIYDVILLRYSWSLLVLYYSAFTSIILLRIY